MYFSLSAAGGRRGKCFQLVELGMACSKTAPVVSGDVVGDAIRKAVDLDAVCQSNTFRGNIVLDREHSACANITHAKDGALVGFSAHILEGIPGNRDFAVARSFRQIIHHRVDRMSGQAGEGAVRNGDIRHTVGKYSSEAISEVALCNNKVVCLCNGIFNHTSLCEFYQGKLLLHLTIPFEEKPKTNLPSDNLKYYRQRKQMTSRQLAEKLDIAPVTVVMYEDGKHPIPYNVAIKLSNVLEIESSLLYDDFSRFLATPYTEALKSVRTALGLSQKAFAERIGIVPSYYYKIEEGNRRPSRKVYQKIYAVLETTSLQTSLLKEYHLQ